MDLPANDGKEMENLARGLRGKTDIHGQTNYSGVLFCLLMHTALLATQAKGQGLLKIGILPFQIYAADRERAKVWSQQVARSSPKNWAKKNESFWWRKIKFRQP